MIYTAMHELREFFPMSPAEESGLSAIIRDYPMRIPDYYLDLIDFTDEKDPIRLMSVPSFFENDTDGSLDTSGEQTNTILPGLQHKYRQTAMILSTNKCAMYCRHCFRKRLVGLPSEEVAAHLPEIADYISAHREITNVLISGGDALMNSTALIRRYLELLTPIDHLDFIRFGSRIPVVFPARITEDSELLRLFADYSKHKQLIVVTQFNHPRELTDEAKCALDSLRRCGVILRNQTVLMRDINSDPEVLGALLRQLTAFGVMPYYVFQCRPVLGVKNRFQIPLREAYQIVQAAKAMQNGFGKCFRFCMSHMSGKIEVLGELPNGEMLFKYHEAKYLSDYGKPFALNISDDCRWLPDDFRLMA